MEIEVWKNIPGFEEYQTSNFGNVRSLDRYINQKSRKANNYTHKRFIKGRLLKPYIIWSNNKYPHYAITIGRRKKFLVHRLILLTFIGECPKGMECCHNDGDGLNNKLENLRWDTAANNQMDRYKHGTITYGCLIGSAHPCSVLKEEDILYIRSTPNYKGKCTEMAKKYNVAMSTISSILQGLTWKHI